VTIVPFYDRSGLIKETIGTLEHALTHEILITIMVVLVLVVNIRASIIISGMLPIAVLITFVIMRYVGVDANVVALSGIAIAIGVMVDVGIVFVENIISHKELPENIDKKGEGLLKVIFNASKEVAPAIITALSTTVVSFLPVFFMVASEGKLFRPLAFTKTFALIVTLILGLILIPTATYFIFSLRKVKRKVYHFITFSLIISGISLVVVYGNWIAIFLSLIGVVRVVQDFVPFVKTHSNLIFIGLLLMIVTGLLTYTWMPLGVSVNLFLNMFFVLSIIGSVLAVLWFVVYFYKPVLKWFLAHKTIFYMMPVVLLLWGLLSWKGVSGVFGWAVSSGIIQENSALWKKMNATFPPLGEEFMPTLDEGSFLLMPTTMTHSGVEENIDVIRKLDLYVSQIPEVEQVVGKWGRVNSALDPAPISMFENTINYKPEYILDERGNRLRFATDGEGGYILSDGSVYNSEKDGYRTLTLKDLVPDENGQYFRQWRSHIHSPDDIWEEIVKATRIPGVTSAPKLQPIQTRLVMLSTGMRAPMGIKVFGPDLLTIEKTGLQLEEILQHVPSIEPKTVFADRIVGKPYMEIDIDREAIARYGLSIADVQRFIEVMIGGKSMTTTVEGRERFDVRLRYARDYRGTPDELKEVLLTTKQGVKVPLGEVANIQYRKGPQMIRSEDTFLSGYVIFDKKGGVSEVEVVNEARKIIENKIDEGSFKLPPGVTYKFTGNYENQVRASERFSILIPLSLIIIFLILYFQFKNTLLSILVFSGVFVAFAGGFIMIWLYGQEWFLNFSIAGTNMRHLFDMHSINMSVAVWVGFIALFGIATDDGVIMGTFIQQSFEKEKPNTVQEIRHAIVEAGSRRVRPAMMTAATAIIALIPVLSSTGKGADIMVPMAIPTFGGMLIQLITMFVVPVTYSLIKEMNIKNVDNDEK
ncbi:MAG: efflux RND transporter permease subunit, partial [Cyclobacteriaceae bacterium]|nr:efflux RND transporter permease subunit [Cyclobacteriaceae bacterium]